jgi:hypothetical protein
VSVEETERGEAFGGSTEPDGSYTVSGLSSGVYTVSFSAPGDLTHYYREAASAQAANKLTLASGAALTGIDAEMQLAGAISGTVTDASGAPLEGIFVTVFNDTTNVGSAETAANGTYSVGSVPAGSSYTVKFAAAPQVAGFNPGGGNYLPQYYDDEAIGGNANPVTVVGGATTTGIDAKLASGAMIGGTVTDSSNAPVRGMRVTAYGADGEPAGSWFTEANGHYAIDQLPSGSYALEFAPASANGAPNDLPQFYGGRTTLAGASAVSAVAGSETEVNEQVTTGGQVMGTVTDAEGHYVPSARVRLLNAAGEAEAEGQAGFEGTYDIDALQSGTYFAEFLPPFGGIFQTNEDNYLISFFEDQGSLADAKPIDVALGSTITGVDGSLPEGAELTGTVSGTGETPLANIAVTAYGAAGEEVARTLTATNGTYTIGGLTTGAYRLRFAVETAPFAKSPGNYAPQFDGGASSLASATPVSVTVGAPAGRANAQMQPGASISGTVTNPAEEPVGDEGVDVYDEQGAFAGSAYTAANGTYTVPDLAGGSYRVGFADDAQGPEALNYAPQFYASEPSLETATPVSVPAGEEVSGINARLTVGATIEGRVTEEESGAPPTARVLVQVYDEADKYVASVVVQADGSYSVGSLAPGTYKVGFEGLPPGEGYEPTFFEGSSLASARLVHVTAGQPTTGIDAEIKRTTGSIAGSITNAGGQGIGAQVVAYDEHGDAIAQTSATADGSYAIAGLLPGFYRLCFSASGYASACYGGAATLAQTDAVLVVAGATAEGIDQQMAVPGEPVATPSPAPVSTALLPSLTPSGGTGVLGSHVTQLKRPLTRAQKLARALAACAKLENKHKRAKCVATARRRYPLRKRSVAHKTQPRS